MLHFGSDGDDTVLHLGMDIILVDAGNLGTDDHIAAVFPDIDLDLVWRGQGVPVQGLDRKVGREIPEEFIRELEKKMQPVRTLTIKSPFTGTVIMPVV